MSRENHDFLFFFSRGQRGLPPLPPSRPAGRRERNFGESKKETENALTTARFFDRIFGQWRVVRVVEGAALEMLCTKVPRVRIPNSPPEKDADFDTIGVLLFCTPPNQKRPGS